MKTHAHMSLPKVQMIQFSFEQNSQRTKIKNRKWSIFWKKKKKKKKKTGNGKIIKFY